MGEEGIHKSTGGTRLSRPRVNLAVVPKQQTLPCSAMPSHVDWTPFCVPKHVASSRCLLL